LIVSFTPSTTEPFDISTTNGISAFPLFGAIQGFSSSSTDLSTGSPNYVYLGGSGETPANAPPASPGNSFTAATSIAEQSESAIWSFDSNTHELTAQWVNTDSSEPAITIGYTQDVLVLTSNLDSFVGTFGPTQKVSLKFVLV